MNSSSFSSVDGAFAVDRPGTLVTFLAFETRLDMLMSRETHGKRPKFPRLLRHDPIYTQSEESVCQTAEMPIAEATLHQFWNSPGRAYAVNALSLSNPCSGRK